MRIGNCVTLWLAAAVFAALPVQESAAQKIEAVKGKAYRLTKKHGPWMIMVASFQEPPEDYKTDGLTPAQAADELVYELRLKGIPAYTFSRDEVSNAVESRDRMGRARQSVVNQPEGVCVLAGNYKNPDDGVARRTLEHVKTKFQPQFLAAERKSGQYVTVLKSGGVFRKTPGRPTPLSGAFLTVNPILSPEEVAQRQEDPLIARLNAGSDYSLLQNNGKYTVVVASFYGQANIQSGDKADRLEKDFKVTGFLDSAADSAFQLCKALRQGNFNTQSDPNQAPQLRKYDAYVFHDRHRSLVTVGSFDSAHDPEIKKLADTFRAKPRPVGNGKGTVLAAEILTIPAVVKDPAQMQKRWWFDPQPTLMEVPRLSY